MSNPARKDRLNRQKSAAAIVLMSDAWQRKGQRLSSGRQWRVCEGRRWQRSPERGTPAEETGEARTVRRRAEHLRHEPNWKPAGVVVHHRLSSTNRPVRTRIPGGVGGAGRRPAPPIPITPGMGAVACRQGEAMIPGTRAKTRGRHWRVIGQSQGGYRPSHTVTGRHRRSGDG